MANTLDQGFDYPGFDYAPQRSKIARKRALAQALQQQGMAPLETNRMSGGWAVPISPFEGLAKLAQTYVGGMAGKAAEKDQADLATKAQGDYRTSLAAALKNDFTPEQIESLTAAGSNPMAAQQMPLITSLMQEKRKMQMLRDWLGGGEGQPQGAPAEPQVGQGTVLSPDAPQPAQRGGMGNMPVGARNVMGGALLGIPGLTDLGKMQHHDAGTRGGVQYDQKGNAYVVNNAGQPQYLPGITARDRNEFLDTGPTIQPTNPYTGQPGGPPIQKGLAPMQSAELPLKQQDAAIAASQHEFKTGRRIAPPQQPAMVGPAPVQQGAPIPRAQPAGRPIPTSQGMTPEQQAELAAKRTTERPDQTRAATTSIGEIDRSIAELDRLMNQPGLGRITGPIAGRVPIVGGLTDEGADAQANIDTIKSQIGVRMLSAMREASKTGGAVGNVTEKEWPILQNQLGALQQSQTTEQFKENLKTVRESLARMKTVITQAYEMTYGRLPSIDPISGAEVKGSGGGGRGLNSESVGASQLSATNPKTGEKIYSDDGGKTWHK